MLLLLFTAFAMSISFAIQPGVIGFESLRRGISHGWTAALHVELGSLVGDATWALIALLGASILFQNPIISLMLGLFGCGLLLKFAWEAWQASRSDMEISSANDDRSNHFVAGAMLSLGNPQNITAWLGMSGTIIGLGFLNPQPMHLAVFFAGFMIAQVCWCFFFATVVEYGRRALNQQVYRYINMMCAVFLAYLGVALFIQTVQMI
jgi:chemosensory pili system protein ChpE